MQLFEVVFEAHSHGATIYVVGLLGDLAALRTEEVVRQIPRLILSLRVDLRAVDLIDPSAFVRVARSLNRWRDARSGRVAIEFPARSQRPQTRHLRLVDQPNTMGMAVSTAMSCPMNMSPG